MAKKIYRFQKNQLKRTKIVVIGGGTGLSTLLSGLKHYSQNITAIVTVADDGGSSGKLRRELGVLPPGDFRNCIAALADDDSLIAQLFQYRFRTGPGLEGHSFGNLFITALAEMTGSFEQALAESGRVLKILGRILPSTIEDVKLFAELDEGPSTRKVIGESAIPEAKLPIERVYLQPNAPPAYPPALQAILNANLIIAGPGSLYTSIIPNLLVAEIAPAIQASQAKKIYVCNVATQPGETEDYTVHDHVYAIEHHTNMIDNRLYEISENYMSNIFNLAPRGGILFDYVLVNNNLAYPIPEHMSHLKSILPDEEPTNSHYRLIKADVIDERHPWRHDPTKLAHQLMLWYDRNQH